MSDDVQIPESEAVQTGMPKAAVRKKSLLKLGLISGVALTGLAAVFLIGGNAQLENSRVPALDGLNTTPGGDASEAYREIAASENENRARLALERNTANLPIPIDPLAPIEEDISLQLAEADTDTNARRIPVEAQPAPQKIEPSVRPVAVRTQAPVRQKVPIQKAESKPIETFEPDGQQQEQQENPYLSSMKQQVTSTVATTRRYSMNVQNVKGENDVDQMVSSDETTTVAAMSEETKGQVAAEEETAAMLIAPGDILLAETLISVNSDANSPLLAEIVEGPYRGARLVGRFTTDTSSDAMVVEFSSMTLPDGTSYGISAFAVDGVTAEAQVRSDVKRRFGQRYIPIMAAAFVNGFASSASQVGTSVTNTSSSTTTVDLTASQEQSAYAGLAAAASVVASDIAANSASGPKVILADGYGIGVIFAEAVYE